MIKVSKFFGTKNEKITDEDSMVEKKPLLIFEKAEIDI
jgi:hypothetical protein